MRIFIKIRAIFVGLMLLWSVLYLPLYMQNDVMFAPLSACQIPLLPIFWGVSVWYVVYALFFLFAIVCILLSFRSKFSGKKWLYVAPFLLTLLDCVGQYICYSAAAFEKYEEGRLEAYYYYNGITPVAPGFYLAGIALDVLLFAVLIVPVFKCKKQRFEVPERSSGITVDNWSEIFDAEALPQDFASKVGEEHNQECEKK